MTDGELAVTKALKAVLGEAVFIFIHMKDNIRQKLTHFLLPERIREEITKDNIGYLMGAIYVNGILDAESTTDFDLCLAALREKWVGFEQSVHLQKGAQVYEGSLKMKQLS